MKLHFTGTKRQRGEGSKDLLSLGDDFNDDEEDVSDMDDDSDEVNSLFIKYSEKSGKFVSQKNGKYLNNDQW